MDKEQVKDQTTKTEATPSTPTPTPTVSVEEFNTLKNEFNSLKSISESKDKTIETLLGKVENFAKLITVSLEKKEEVKLPSVKELLKDL